jgi:hypothetical protein
MYRKQAKAMLSVASIAVLGGVTLTAGGLAAVKAIAALSEQRTQQQQEEQATSSEVCIHAKEPSVYKLYVSRSKIITLAHVCGNGFPHKAMCSISCVQQLHLHKV